MLCKLLIYGPVQRTCCIDIDIDIALLVQEQALFAQQQAKIVDAEHKLVRLDVAIVESDFKTKALTFELVYY
ncbi:MAG: hypothetical protein M3Y65_05120 [Pseudomonadota bacterium]|nr:hypothetical protein [Pseudomonadota bacterium]